MWVRSRNCGCLSQFRDLTHMFMPSVWFSENYGRNYSQYINNVKFVTSLQWCHNECDGISDHWYLYCLLDHLFWRRSKKTSKLHDTDLFEGNSLVTSEFSAQWGSNAENVSIWWRHHMWSSLHEKLSWPLVRSDKWLTKPTCPKHIVYLSSRTCGWQHPLVRKFVNYG